MFPVKLKTLAMVFCVALPLGGALLDAASSVGEDFRVENKIFVGREKTPASESTTIFQKGVVYDFMKTPEEVVVLDQAAGRFVLLDTARRIRAELTTADVAEFCEQLRLSAEQQSDPFFRFLAAPKFEEEFDEASNELTLSSEWITYRLTLEDVESPEIVAQYREFADWYARLNTLLNRGSRPPTARLAVNEALSRRKAIAREVHLTLTSKKTFPPRHTTLRSEHQLIREVAEFDLDRVTQTQQFMSIFKPVSFEEYREADGL